LRSSLPLSSFFDIRRRLMLSVVIKGLFSTVEGRSCGLYAA
jgi:hypothetical protein